MLSMAWRVNRGLVFLQPYFQCWKDRVHRILPTPLWHKNGSSDCVGSEQNEALQLFPVDTSLESSVERDAVIRSFLLGQFWNRKPEYLVMRDLLMRPFTRAWAVYGERYPLVFDYEWMVMIEGNLHIGDMVFADGCGRFLVVEIKSILRGPFAVGSGKTLRTRRKLARKKCRLQAELYARAWHELNPHVLVTEGVTVAENEVEHIVTLTRE